MSYTYQIGIRPIVRNDGELPSGDANKIEIAINEIQSFLGRFELPMSEVFSPDEKTSVGTAQTISILAWQGKDAAPILWDASPALKAAYENVGGEIWSAPNSFELPGSACDIFVPNLNPELGVTRMSQLQSIQVLPESKTISHQELYGKDKITVGCLNSQIALLEEAITEKCV